jgi:hypothetical protein
MVWTSNAVTRVRALVQAERRGLYSHRPPDLAAAHDDTASPGSLSVPSSRGPARRLELGQLLEEQNRVVRECSDMSLEAAADWPPGPHTAT